MLHSDALNFTNKTVSEVVALLDAQKDLEAKLVDTTGEGTNYSVIISGDETGLTNAFRITGHSMGDFYSSRRKSSCKSNFKQI